MFDKRVKAKARNIWYHNDSKKYMIFVYTDAYSIGEEYQCSSFDINKCYLILRLLDDRDYYINIDAVHSFTVREIKEEAND